MVPKGTRASSAARGIFLRHRPKFPFSRGRGRYAEQRNDGVSQKYIWRSQRDSSVGRRGAGAIGAGVGHRAKNLPEESACPMSPATVGPSELSKQNPWPGLRAFGENDVDFFFGREREAAELFSLVQRSPVVVLYGQSGLGKTSLLQAGLFPRLKALDFFPVRVRFDHGDDALPLAQQITAA